MNKKLVLLPVLGAVALGATGCASVQSASSPYGEYDEAYVAAVERTARRTGVDVYWVTLPQKRNASN